MGLDRKLERWVSAGLMDAEQAAHIRRFEAERLRPALPQAAAALAGTAIAIGLVSITAANWDDIPGRVKLGVALAFISALGYFFVQREWRSANWLREAGLLVLYGGVLASIALIGQVYQLGGNAAAALVAWSVLSFPALTHGRSAALGSVWLLGLETTYLVVLGELLEGHASYEALGISLAYCLPLACIALGEAGWLRRNRPAFAGVARTLGWLQLLLAGSAGTLAFYFQLGLEQRGALWLGAALAAAVSAWLALRQGPGPAANARRGLLAASFGCVQAPLLLPHQNWALVAFLSFLALWWLVAVAAYRSGARRVLHAATALIALRLLVGYVELFGSLLETGVGLVLGGVLGLFLIWAWSRQRRSWDQKLAAGAAPPPGGAAS